MVYVISFEGSLLGYLANFLRLLLASIFTSSYLLAPLQQLALTIWARIVDSDKPVFTLLFGGAGAAAECIEKLIYHSGIH
jgi:hypothetical protein